jgi:hypothetical protein
MMAAKTGVLGSFGEMETVVLMVVEEAVVSAGLAAVTRERKAVEYLVLVGVEVEAEVEVEGEVKLLRSQAVVESTAARPVSEEPVGLAQSAVGQVEAVAKVAIAARGAVAQVVVVAGVEWGRR